ncbi:MAG: hypothetical protein JWM19_960 [Actinomycetia bacterium]|nr:hypothetical protein [Actinomycetes bacterium]
MAETDGKTVITFRLDPFAFGLISPQQAQQLVGNRVPFDWKGQQADATVIAVTAKPGDIRITVELDRDPGFIADIADSVASTEGAAED